MQTEPQPIFPMGADSSAANESKGLLAPVWHTLLIVIIVLANSYLSAKFLGVQRGSAKSGPHMADYLLTIGFELFLLFLVWAGLRIKKRTLREVIGGRWNSPEDVLIDVGIALGFWVVSALVLVALAYALGQTNPGQLNDIKQRLGPLLPGNQFELDIFVLLSVIAGFVEEIVFRGYLQQQIGALAGNAYVGLIVSALIFGGGHGYEGVRNMIRIFVFGALFGALALWRKNLRPGMMAHAWQDGLAGILGYTMIKMGKF